MMMDIYYLGVVLARKYRYLRIAYTVFMVGLIVAVIAFAVATILDNTITATTTKQLIDYQ
jgi:hypothetical protein